MPVNVFLLQVWSTALKGDSSLLTPATLAKLSLEEAACVAQLCSLLLLQHAHYLDQASATIVSRLLLAVLLHYAAPVRRAGIKAVGQCLAEKSALAGLPSALCLLPSHCCHLPPALSHCLLTCAFCSELFVVSCLWFAIACLCCPSCNAWWPSFLF